MKLYPCNKTRDQLRKEYYPGCANGCPLECTLFGEMIIEAEKRINKIEEDHKWG